MSRTAYRSSESLPARLLAPLLHDRGEPPRAGDANDNGSILGSAASGTGARKEPTNGAAATYVHVRVEGYELLVEEGNDEVPGEHGCPPWRANVPPPVFVCVVTNSLKPAACGDRRWRAYPSKSLLDLAGIHTAFAASISTGDGWFSSTISAATGLGTLVSSLLSSCKQRSNWADVRMLRSCWSAPRRPLEGVKDRRACPITFPRWRRRLSVVGLCHRSQHLLPVPSPCLLLPPDLFRLVLGSLLSPSGCSRPLFSPLPPCAQSDAAK